MNRSPSIPRVAPLRKTVNRPCRGACWLALTLLLTSPLAAQPRADENPYSVSGKALASGLTGWLIASSGPAASAVPLIFISPAQPPETPSAETPAPATAPPADEASAPETDADQASVDVDPELAAMIEKVDAQVRDWYDTLGEMQAVQIRYHNGTGEKDEEYHRQFRKLEAESRDKHQQAFDAAIQLAQRQPQGIPGVWDFLISSVNLRGELDWYESVAAAAQAIKDLEANSEAIELDFPLLDAYLGRALVTEGEYERAGPPLQRALQVKEPEETDFRLLTMLERLPAEWEREQRLRKADADSNLPRVVLHTTRGDVVIELFEEQAPNTVANFITLVEQGFYDQVPFYTVIEHMFAISGDPIGDGSGDAGYRIPDEYDATDSRHAFRGSLLMSKLPDPGKEPGFTVPDTASSQFMLTYLPLPIDRGEYTVFGRVIEGMSHASVLTRLNPDEKKGENTRVLPPDRILSAEVLRKRDHPYDVERIEYRQ